MPSRRRAPLVGLVEHTDRGSPYASADHRAALAEHGMSRKADCWDNAVSETFFSTLPAELVDDERFPTRGAAETIIGSYIEDFHNLQQLRSRLDCVIPG